jgi:hypothetical protein
MLLLGRARLVVNPAASGSPTVTNTMGIVFVSPARASVTAVV